MIAEIVAVGGLAISGGLTIALIKLAFNNTRAIKDADELAKKAMTLTTEKALVEIDLSQTRANRDILRETIDSLQGDLLRTQAQRDHAEGQRDELLKAIEKNPSMDEGGKLVAAGINAEVRGLKKLSEMSRKPG